MNLELLLEELETQEAIRGAIIAISRVQAYLLGVLEDLENRDENDAEV